MTLKFTILGCGSSGGVPRPALGWGACDPNNPKNRRRRTALLVERRASPQSPSQAESSLHAEIGAAAVTRVLVDTPPDLREQLLDAETDWLDGVLYSHEHADHTHGVDDLRAYCIKQRALIDVYLDDHTARSMHQRFDYCFKSPPGSDYPPMLREHRMSAGRPIVVPGRGGPIEALPIRQEHGEIASYGFRFGPVGYSCDIGGLPPESAAALTGIEVWIVDALRERPHPSHFSVADALGWIERLKPRRAILTNLHAELDFEALRANLPANVEPAYDGLSFEIEDGR
jgi:phosphoribosyl 1,2-cyclic phosphate phosphodiesterase